MEQVRSPIKMEECDNNSRVAGILAYHLVNLVLQEGCMIANAALESGQPREYLSTRLNMRSDLTYVIPAEDATYNFIEGADSNAKMDSEVLMTSTPQKLSDDKQKKENGRGDEYTEIEQSELNNSTSLFINQLFDISDLELGITDAIPLQNVMENELLPPLVNNVMDFYMNAALDAFRLSKEKHEEEEKRVRISGNSSFCYVEDASDNVENNSVFYIDNESDNEVPTYNENVFEIPQDPMTSQMALQQCAVTNNVKTENVDVYENTYLTLNRDYDQLSDEEDYPILQDPKGMLMQEIILLTANTSDDTRHSYEEPEDEIHTDRYKRNECLAATSGVSANSRKSGLVRRWRAQGAKFLACIRGWWRRKATGKRRGTTSANRRAASLRDERVSAAACRFKSNTINEALLHSDHWMDYSFETKPNQCGDVV